MEAKPPLRYSPICSRKDISMLWKTTTHNIGITYANNPQKQIQYKMIDMGAFCVMNNIDGEMLELLVRFGNEFKNRFHDITPEDIEKIKDYKKFKLFEEATK